MKKILLWALLLCLSAPAISQNRKQVALLSVNDIHAAIDNFPAFADIADSLRKTYPHLLVFAAGDNRTGNPINDMYPEPSYPMTALMNAAGFHLSCVGNHEFDAGIGAFRTQINKSDFPYICANVAIPDTMRTHVYPYKFLEVDGVRIGVLGLLAIGESGIPDTGPANVRGLTFFQEYETILQYGWMREKCDLFLLLSHCGFEADVVFAQRVPFIDAIIGGHSHTTIDKAEFYGGKLVTQAGSRLKYATFTLFEIENGKVEVMDSHLIDVAHHKKENAAVRAMVDKFNDNPALNRQVAVFEEDIDSYEALGCLMSDALRDGTGADIALQNFGGVRSGTHAKGPISVKDVLQLDPFNNDAVVFQMNGEQLRNLILQCRRADYMRAPFVSGCRYTLYLDQDDDALVKHLQLTTEDGEAFDMEKIYTVVTNNYVAAVSRIPAEVEGRNTHLKTADLILAFLKKHGSVNYRARQRIAEVRE